ncbi:hypothetical protein R3P38DRAFT_2841834 [Favolaschia claudopus]|uniref:F-box domain-containing protein n=1 Tax=Favolaschia claudopus TaxID=2862362 RepID=A0AAW0DWX2_9AGAR
MSLTMTEIQPAHKTRARALSLALVAASRTAPLLDIPTELGLEILELALTHTPFTILFAVSKSFSALISTILYRHIVLDSLQTLSLFSRTAKSKSPEFLDAHIKTLTVEIEPWRFNAAARIELERVVAACTGLRALAVSRPGVLCHSLSYPTLPRALPSEVTIQSFDASAAPSASSHAAHLSASITHLRISEPGDTWHSPLSILAFFGSTPHLTHLALARRMDANIDNDQVFANELRYLLANRRNLKMIVVRVFPAHWPQYCDDSYPGAAGTVSAESSSIWAALATVAEFDKRLILVSAGFKNRGVDSVVYEESVVPRVGRRRGFSDFWEQSRRDWEARTDIES